DRRALSGARSSGAGLWVRSPRRPRGPSHSRDGNFARCRVPGSRRPGRIAMTARRTPRRIAVACFPTLGGSGIVATEVGCHLAARGHEVRFFAPEPPARLEPGAPRVSFQRVTSSVALANASAYPLALASALAEAVMRDGFDVIHAHYAI